MITITGSQMLTTLEEVVKGKESFVYTPPQPPDSDEDSSLTNYNCLYLDTWTKCPSCGVGQALSRLGVPNEVLFDMDLRDNPDINGREVQAILEREGFKMDDLAIDLARTFQRRQDDRVPWGHALTITQDRAKELA